MAHVTLPREILPTDGRFGCGPSKIRAEQLASLAGPGSVLLGTSHRQAPVKSLVGQVRMGLSDLLRLPDGYEIILGNGGSTAFWDAASFGLIEARAQNLVFGEFGGKFAAAAGAPWLQSPDVRKAEPGTSITAEPVEGVDVYRDAQVEGMAVVFGHEAFEVAMAAWLANTDPDDIEAITDPADYPKPGQGS